jgi:hypothetical protein
MTAIRTPLRWRASDNMRQVCDTCSQQSILPFKRIGGVKLFACCSAIRKSFCQSFAGRAFIRRVDGFSFGRTSRLLQARIS